MKHRDKTTVLSEIMNLLDDSQTIMIRTYGHTLVFEGLVEDALTSDNVQKHYKCLVDSIWYSKSINTLVIDLF